MSALETKIGEIDAAIAAIIEADPQFRADAIAGYEAVQRGEYVTHEDFATRFINYRLARQVAEMENTNGST